MTPSRESAPRSTAHAPRLAERCVEFDHDDILASEALAEIARAFDEHATASLVYSHTAQILEDGSRDDSRFDVSNGWVYRDTTVDGRMCSTSRRWHRPRTTSRTSGSPRTTFAPLPAERTNSRRI